MDLLKVYGAEVTLMIAAMLGDRREVERLLEAGSDVNAKSAEGLTALTGAADWDTPMSSDCSWKKAPMSIPKPPMEIRLSCTLPKR